MNASIKSKFQVKHVVVLIVSLIMIVVLSTAAVIVSLMIINHRHSSTTESHLYLDELIKLNEDYMALDQDIHQFLEKICLKEVEIVNFKNRYLELSGNFKSKEVFLQFNQADLGLYQALVNSLTNITNRISKNITSLQENQC